MKNKPPASQTDGRLCGVGGTCPFLSCLLPLPRTPVSVRLSLTESSSVPVIQSQPAPCSLPEEIPPEDVARPSVEAGWSLLSASRRTMNPLSLGLARSIAVCRTVARDTLLQLAT